MDSKHNRKTKLTKPQERFIECYRRNGRNKTQAAIEAGYKKENARIVAYQLMKKPHVAKFVDEIDNMVRQNSQEETNAILAQVVDSMMIAAGEKDIPGTDGVKRYDAASRLRAAELLGKYYAMWTDKTVVQISDEDLLRDFQVVLSKKLDPEMVIEILNEVELRVTSRRPTTFTMDEA